MTKDDKNVLILEEYLGKKLGEVQAPYIYRVIPDTHGNGHSYDYLILNEKERELEVKEFLKTSLYQIQPKAIVECIGLSRATVNFLQTLKEQGNMVLLDMVESTVGLDFFTKIYLDKFGGRILSMNNREKEYKGYYIYQI